MSEKNPFLEYEATKIALQYMDKELRAGRAVYVVLDDIKENGLDLDSPLLWALLRGPWIAMNSSGDWTVFPEKPSLCNSAWGYMDMSNHSYSEISIKINYTGDWKDSLTKRPEQ